ncbi:MAG: LLM class flavin-dependent oxidoreductase [Candidatus Asgardarchaeia archaeon]
MRKNSFGLALATNIPLSQITRFSILAEKYNFDSIWVAEMISCYDLYQVLSVISSKTSRVHIGPGATNPHTRHPVITAKNIITLNDISDGRAHLALGAGDRLYLESLGLYPKSPLRAVEEAIIIIKTILTKGEIDFDGQYFKARNIKIGYISPHEVPIFIAGNGPKMLKLAGTYGDGVLFNAIPVVGVKKAKKFIEDSLSETRITSRPFYMANMIPLAIADSKKQALKQLKPFFSLFLRHLPSYLQDLFLDVFDSSLPIDRFVRDLNKVPEKVLELFSIVGSVKECIDKIEQFFKEGIHQLVFILPRDVNRERLIRLIGTEIIPLFRS